MIPLASLVAIGAIVALGQAAATEGAQLYAAGRDEAALAACGADEVELRARCLLALGRRDEAAATLRALPRRRMAADLLLAQSAAPGAEADAILARWGTADPDGAELRLARARLHLASGRVALALADARFVLAREPKRSEAQLLLARCADAAGRPDEARRLLAPLVLPLVASLGEEIHLRREAIVASAAAAMRMQQYDAAIEPLRALVDDGPTVVAWRTQLAAALSLSGRFGDSMAQWEQAVALAPKDGELRWRLADLYRSQMRVDDAIAQYEAMLALGVQPGVAELRLAELHLERGGDGDLERARVHVERAVALAPESGDVLEARARVEEQQGDFAAAKESHREAFARNPLRFDALYRRALLLAKSRDESERAESAALLARHRRIEPFLDEFRRTQQEIAVNPGNAAALTRLAGMLNLAGEYATARVWAERADPLDPRSVQNAVQFGYILANLGDRDGARNCFEKALALLGNASAAPEVVATLRDYVQKIDRGEPLPTPLGELVRDER